MSAPLMLRVLSASVAAANRAGNIIREVMSTGKLGVVDKVSGSNISLGRVTIYKLSCSHLDVLYFYIQGGNDPQTEADRKAQRCIVASLTKRFPGIRVEGEEVRHRIYSRLAGQFCWSICPS